MQIILLGVIAVLLLGILLVLIKGTMYHSKGSLESRKLKFWKALVGQWEMKFWEDEITTLFLRFHEVPRLDNLISYNTQKRDELLAKMKASGRNDEKLKVRIQQLDDAIKAYKEAKSSDLVLASKTKNMIAMLKAKVEFIKSRLITGAIQRDLESAENEDVKQPIGQERSSEGDTGGDQEDSSEGE